MKTLRIETKNGVGSIILTRAAEYNTITPELRDELSAAIDLADADHGVHVILLRAEGAAFCAGYALDTSTRAQSGERARKRVWDSVADYGMISQYVNVYMKLWYAKKPTIAAVQGWCIGGGTDMVLCSDLIISVGVGLVRISAVAEYGARRPLRCGCIGWASNAPSATC